MSIYKNLMVLIGTSLLTTSLVYSSDAESLGDELLQNREKGLAFGVEAVLADKLMDGEIFEASDEQLQILGKNDRFDKGLKDWGCKEFTLVNNTASPCVVQADEGCEVRVSPKGSWNFPRRESNYYSLLLKEGAGVFHIDSQSTDATRHIITLDTFRSVESLREALESKTNQALKDLFSKNRIYEISFENHTDKECTVRLNEGCEYSIAAKSSDAAGTYQFPRKHEPHHAFEFMSVSGIPNLEDLGGGKYKVTLDQDPASMGIVDQLLEDSAELSAEFDEKKEDGLDGHEDEHKVSILDPDSEKVSDGDGEE